MKFPLVMSGLQRPIMVCKILVGSFSEEKNHAIAATASRSSTDLRDLSPAEQSVSAASGGSNKCENNDREYIPIRPV